MTTTKTTSRFETETCTRCGGTGNYSYCQMYGTRCFKCAGSGRQYTKRGAAALAHLRALRTVKGADVRLGDRVRIDGIPGFSATTYITVESAHTRLNSASMLDPTTGEVRVVNHLMFEGRTPRGEETGLGVFATSDVRLVPSKEEAERQIQAAVEFQATLTKAGTPRRR